MLTRRSGTAARTKMLAFIPVAVVSLLCFSQNVFSQRFEQNGNMVTFMGNKVELSQPSRDTIEIEDPVTGQRSVKVMEVPSAPIKLNGAKIYNPDEVNAKPAYVGSNGSLWRSVMKGLRDNLLPLGNGEYVLNVNNFVVNESGAIVYFKYLNVTRIEDNKQNMSAISPAMQQRIEQLVTRQLVSANGLQPAVHNGKEVPALHYDRSFWNHFKIQNGKVMLQKDNSWEEI